MPPTLNDDCWSIILAQLFGDFRTLARMMQVSRHFFAIVAPVLYAQLGHENNKPRIRSWSPNKRRKLSILLLISSGFLEFKTMATISATREETSKSSSHPVEHGLKGRQYHQLDVSCFKTSLFIDYFGLLTRLPSHLLYSEFWHCTMGLSDACHVEGIQIQSDKELFNRSKVRLAKVLSDIYFQNLTNIEHWLRVVKDFENLELLLIGVKGTDNGYNVQEKEKLYEFVTLHKVAFPGKMEEIRTRRIQASELEMDLNILLEKPRSLRLSGHNRIFEQFQMDPLDDNNQIGQGSGGSGKEINSDSKENNSGGSEKKLRNLFGSIKSIKLLEKSFSHGPRSTFSTFVSKALQECRELETIHIEGPVDSLLDLSFNKLFDWSAQNFQDASMVRGLVESDLGQLSPSGILGTTLSRLPMSLKSFTGHNLSGSILMNVMNGFRYSLEQIDFSRAHHLPIDSLDWSWRLPRLRVLRLGHCMFPLYKLEKYCPALQELYLDDVDYRKAHIYLYEDDHIQAQYMANNNILIDHQQEISLAKQTVRVVPNFRVLHSKNIGHRSKSMDFLSLGTLHHLEDLCLRDAESFLVDMFDVINRAQPIQLLHWDLTSLRKLNLLEFSDANCHTLLLRSAPNIQQFSMPTDMFCSSFGGFWQETKWQSLERVADFESQLNSLWPNQEQLHQQLVDELETEKLIVEKYKTLDGQDVWNAHVSKIRSLEFGGRCTGIKVEELGKMLQSGEWKSKKFNNINDQENNNLSNPTAKDTNLFTIEDWLCFPRLCHVKFNFATEFDYGCLIAFGIVVETLLQRKGMRCVEIPHRAFTGGLVFKSAQLSPGCVPRKWTKDEYCSLDDDDAYEVDQEADHGCFLVVRDSLRSSMYYRLREYPLPL